MTDTVKLGYKLYLIRIEYHWHIVQYISQNTSVSIKNLKKLNMSFVAQAYFDVT